MARWLISMSDRTPLKHKSPALLKSKLPWVRKWAARHVELQERQSQRADCIREARKRLKRERQKEERKLAREAPEAKIAAAATERLRLLQRATKFMRTDRQLQQLRGHEEEGCIQSLHISAACQAAKALYTPHAS